MSAHTNACWIKNANIKLNTLSHNRKYSSPWYEFLLLNLYFCHVCHGIYSQTKMVLENLKYNLWDVTSALFIPIPCRRSPLTGWVMRKVEWLNFPKPFLLGYKWVHQTGHPTYLTTHKKRYRPGKLSLILNSSKQLMRAKARINCITSALTWIIHATTKKRMFPCS